MKTFLLSIPQKLVLRDQGLDARAALCDKSWSIFNDEGVKQLFIFQPDGTLLVSINGIVSTSTWVYIPANKSIIITTEGKSVMFHAAFLDDVVFVLQQDGEGSCLFMIDERNQLSFSPKSLTELSNYFIEKERLLIERERRNVGECRKEVIDNKQKQKEALLNKRRDEIKEKYAHEIELIHKAKKKRKKVGLIICLGIFLFAIVLLLVGVETENESAMNGASIIIMFAGGIAALFFGLDDGDKEVESFVDSKLDDPVI